MKGTAAMLAAGIGIAALLPAAAVHSEPAALGEVVVTATRQIPPSADAASAGTATEDELENRPLLRSVEVLEVVPGLVVTQHSGDGKANQYFLRGFNLDHGTDFATSVDGVPVNMPTHAHGQGYSDLNFLIPELIERIDYRKGVYYPEQADFSAAGAADIHYRSRLEQPFVTVAIDQQGDRRMVAATSTAFAGGQLLLGGDYGLSDGPWVRPEDYQHASAVAKYSAGDDRLGCSLAVMGYDAHWHATDQIPQRAVSAGLISRFGNIDPTDGGRTQRWSVSAAARGRLGAGVWHAQSWFLDYDLDLFSNFTYFTDPVHGDQFEQYDSRHAGGATVDYSLPVTMFAEEGALRGGVQVREDHIDPVALYDTSERIRWKTVSVTEARVTSAALYAAWELRPARWWRVQLGARFDRDHFDVRANLPANSGTASASLVSPKLTLAFGPWSRTEYFLDFGQGFHSNDARGTTISVDPSDGVTPLGRVTPLARATGFEGGVRSMLAPGLELTAALWALRLDSELVLDEDASVTVPSGATRRYGVELAAAWHPRSWMRLDLDLAWTRARFTDFSASGQYLPNAPEKIAALGIEINRPQGWFGGAHVRYFGSTPLTQDDAVRSRPSLQVNAEAGYRFTSALSGTLSVFNLLDRRDDDIEYFYASRLRTEALPVDDLHFHPMEPRSVRASLSYRF
ncbi:MAG TPA: TonB-dependent receptor [Steroidobacteraceae bacterium]|nr:TonB-dependent receptor [Steroidobacteraceae bacterium]